MRADDGQFNETCPRPNFLPNLIVRKQCTNAARSADERRGRREEGEEACAPATEVVMPTGGDKFAVVKVAAAQKARKKKEGSKKAKKEEGTSTDRSDASSSSFAGFSGAAGRTEKGSSSQFSLAESIPEDDASGIRVFEAACAAVASEEEMLHRDEALLSRLQELIPSLQAAAQHEVNVARADAAARLADTALSSDLRQRLMSACRRARRPRIQTCGESTSGPTTAAERQLRDALRSAHTQLDAMASQLDELRVRCRQYEQRLAVVTNVGEEEEEDLHDLKEALQDEGTWYFMPTGESFVVHEISMDAHSELYEIPPWWGKGTGHDKSAAGRALPKIQRIGTKSLLSRINSKGQLLADSAHPKFKLSSKWLQVLTPRLLLSRRPDPLTQVSDPGLDGPPAPTPMPDATMVARPQPQPVKRVSSVGNRLWAKVRAKVLLNRGRYSPRPDDRPPPALDTVHVLGHKTPKGFPRLADPFQILAEAIEESGDERHDDDGEEEEEEEEGHGDDEG